MLMKQELPSGAGGAKAHSELAIRIASAIVMIAMALAAAWTGGILFAAFWALAAIAVFWEWAKMAGVRGCALLSLPVGTGAIALVSLAVILHLPSWAALPVLVLAALFACVSVWLGKNIRDRAWLASGICYAAVIAFFPPYLREFPYHGLANVLWVFSVVWATDVAAYFVGRTLGGPKLWPRVSPNKTWSGFCGGLVAGTVAGVSSIFLLQNDEKAYFSWLLIVVFSAVASMLSQGGDLAESALKRRFGVKDSSSLIPGHGGAMDRLDGFWAAVFFLGMCLLIKHMVYGDAA